MFIIPYLFAAAAMAAAAYLLRKYLASRNKDKNNPFPFLNNDEDKNENERPKASENLLRQRIKLLKELKDAIESGEIKPDGTAKGGDLSYMIPPKFKPVEEMYKAIILIVNQVTFSERNISVPKKVGEDIQETNVPNGDFEILPLRNVSDLVRILPSELNKEEEMFYASLASGQLLKVQPVERIDVFDDRYLRPRRMLRGLQDVSWSMLGERIACSQLLESLLSLKAQKSHADMMIRSFSNSPKDFISASPDEQISYNVVRFFIDKQLKLYKDGTNINSAMMYELDLIEEENKLLDLKHAPQNQLVLITDGTEGINEKVILEKMKANNVVLHTVILGKNHEQLKRVSNKYHFLEIDEDPGMSPW